MVAQGSELPQCGTRGGERTWDLGLALPSSSHHRAWVRLSSPDHSKGDTEELLHFAGSVSHGPLSVPRAPAGARPPPPRW